MVSENVPCTHCGKRYRRSTFRACPKCGGTDERPPVTITAVPHHLITTLPEVPGYRVERVCGLVTVVGASSGLTATSKGEEALTATLTRFAEHAGRLGANAIVGVVGGPFGAGGGITSAFGGDAVGILLMGTGVVVAPIENVTD